MNLEDKIVVITGAAGGLGKALCKQFGQAGARIFALDVQEGALQTLLSEMEQLGISLSYLTCDLRDELASRKAIQQVIALAGGIDLLINNAGITHIQPFRKMDTGALHNVMQVNFFGTVAVTQAALESIISRKGSVVAISSVAGFAPLLGRTAYAASKHAMIGFFETLRTELVDQEVGVMVVCPSFIKTGIGEVEGKGKKTAGKVATPEEVASKIYAAVKRERRFLITGNMGKLSFLVRKFAPGIYDRLMIRKMKSVIV